MSAEYPPLKLFLISVVAVLVGALYLDYRQWLVFAKGSPAASDNLARFAIFRLNDLLMWLKRQDDTDVSALLALPDQHRYLADLPHRTGPRPPLVKWHVPQRVDLATSEDTVPANILSSLVDEYAKAETELVVRLCISRLESKGQAIFITENVKIVRPLTEMWYKDIAHRHDQELSFHVILAPADAAEVVRKGWGVRFPLAGRKQLFAGRAGKVLPVGMVLVYPPRNECESAALKQVIRAAVDYAIVAP